MDPVAKEKWLEGLRSGKFNQTRSVLKSGMDEDAAYCCLGVLCEVNGVHADSNNRYKGSFCTLIEPLREQFGLKVPDVQILVGMNDTDSKSFRQIADWIEKNL